MFHGKRPRGRYLIQLFYETDEERGVWNQLSILLISFEKNTLPAIDKIQFQMFHSVWLLSFRDNSLKFTAGRCYYYF